MASYVKSVTFDCANPPLLAALWAAALGSNVDEDSTEDRAWVEPAGWGSPNLWFRQVGSGKSLKGRPRRTGSTSTFAPSERSRWRLNGSRHLGASELDSDGDLVVMADPEGNEFCVES